jgi:hypothetical protein
MAISNDSIQTKFVEIWSLQLEHFVNSVPVDGVCSISNFLRCTITASESRRDELFAIFVEELKCRKVGTGRNLDELGKAIADLCFGEGPKERKVQERLHRCVVGTQPVFIVAIIHSYFDRNGRINQSNDRCWDSNIIGVPAIRGACEAAGQKSVTFPTNRKYSRNGVWARVP